MNNRNRKWLQLFVILSIISVAIFVCCGIADARAGGGHSYSGGGSGSSGSGGGGIIGALLRPLVRWFIDFCFENPVIGVPLLIVIFYFIIKHEIEERNKKNGDYSADTDFESDSDEDSEYSARSDSSASFKDIINSSENTKTALAGIMEVDPDFSQAKFIKRTKKAFMLIQEAWQKRDVGKVQAFLADGTYERFLIQLDFYKKAHIIDVMENLSISEARILGFESNHDIDSIFVNITASAKNYRANENTKKYIEGDKSEKEFTEIWTFIRRTGAKTLNEKGLIEGYCPNCGTPIAIGRHAKCESCGALLRSGQHDWVLANITQAEEWKPCSNAQIPGVSKYYNFDKGFNIQHIEDRTAVIFWRKVAADTDGNAEILRKMAVDKYCDTLKQEYNNPKGRKYFEDCAIGAIQVIGLDATSKPKEDLLYVKVIWSGLPTSSSEANGGFMASVNKFFKSKKNFTSVFVLKRMRGVMTDVKTGLCAAPCPSCGAAESNSLSNSCEYCGHVMNTGTRDWVLDDVLEFGSEKFNSAFSKARMFSLKPIKFDFPPTPQEKTTKQESNQNRNMNTDVAEEKATVASDKNSAGNNPAEIVQKAASLMGAAMAGAAIVQNMQSAGNNQMSAHSKIKWTIAMMLANGEIHENELRIINEYGIQCGLSTEIVKGLIDEIKSQPNPVEFVAKSTELIYDADLMQMIVRVAFADGKVTAEEITLIRYIGKRMNMNEDVLKNIFIEEKQFFNNH